MDYSNYIGLIQLSVAFNFAFIVIKGIETNKLFENLFKELKETIRVLDINIENRLTLLRTSLKVPLGTDEYVLESLNRKVSSLHIDIEYTKNYVNKRINTSPVYFGPVCLMLGLYGILLIFLISDSQNHVISERAWPLFAFFCILYILYFLVKEFCVFKEILPQPERYNRINLAVIFTTIFLFAISYALIFLWDFITNSVFTGFSLNMTPFIDKIKFISLLIPYASFIVCFTLHYLSVLYARFKLNRINRLLEKQERINNLILADKNPLDFS